MQPINLPLKVPQYVDVDECGEESMDRSPMP